jgi:saccharopine dehydrogenase (NAD+, L-lysine-forming)
MAASIRGRRVCSCAGGAWRSGFTSITGGAQRFDFGERHGRRACAPMKLDELMTLPERYPALRETGLYMAGFNWFIDSVIMPAAVVALRIAPAMALGPVTRLMTWGLRRFSQPPYFGALKLEAAGAAGDELSLVIHHDDAYALTAIPVVACLLQVLDGSVRRPGLHSMAHLPDPVRMLADMRRLGARIETNHRTRDEAGRRAPAP